MQGFSIEFKRGSYLCKSLINKNIIMWQKILIMFDII